MGHMCYRPTHGIIDVSVMGSREVRGRNDQDTGVNRPTTRNQFHCVVYADILAMKDHQVNDMCEKMMLFWKSTPSGHI